MLILYSKIIGLPVAALAEGKAVGRVKDAILKKGDFSVAGFIVTTPRFPISKTMILSGNDLIDLDADALTVRSEDTVLDHKDAVRLSKAVQEGFFGVGQKVITQSGKKVGKVYDFLISPETLAVPKIYVKNLFSEKIISNGAICDFKKKVIVIKDDYLYSPFESAFAAEIV